MVKAKAITCTGDTLTYSETNNCKLQAMGINYTSLPQQVIKQWQFDEYILQLTVYLNIFIYTVRMAHPVTKICLLPEPPTRLMPSQALAVRPVLIQ